MSSQLPISKTKLFKLRKEKHLTQKQVADKIGVSVKSYRGWELSGTIPETETLKRLSMLFNVSTDYLLGLSDTKTINENIKMINKSTGLSEKAIQTLQALNTPSSLEIFDMLNFILSDHLSLAVFCKDLKLLANCNGFDTPCYMDDGILKPISNTTPSNIIYNPTKEKHITIGKKSKSHKGYEGISIPVSSSIKGYAINHINNIVNEWAKGFEKEGD